MTHYTWTKEMIRFMKDASEKTDYYRQIVRLTAGFYDKNSTVLDMGCGLGYLSLELASRFRRVIACDISKEALDVLEHNLRTDSIGSIETMCCDAGAFVPREDIDVLYCCYYGTDNEILEAFERSGAKEAVVVRKNSSRHSFSVTGEMMDGNPYAASLSYFADRGMVRWHTEISCPFAQPFRSLEDAETFFRMHSGNAVIPAGFLESRLTETNDETYPYCFEQDRNSGIILLTKGD